MDRIIVRMMEDNCILLMRNDVVVITIRPERRELKGSEILELLDYHLGKDYQVELENPAKKDEKVIHEVHSLILGLVNDLMKLRETHVEYVPQSQKDKEETLNNIPDNDDSF